MPSTISPTRPESSRAVSWRSRPSTDQPPPHPRDQHALHRDDPSAISPSQKFWTMMNIMRRHRLAAEQNRLHEGVADEAAQRLHLILHHGRHFGGFHPLEDAGGKAQHAIDKLEADAPQHALAEAALVGIDVEFEEAVDDDQQQEHDAQREQMLLAVELDAAENSSTWPMNGRSIGEAHEGLGGARLSRSRRPGSVR